MKNKLLIVLVLLLFVGCGKTTEDKKQKSDPTSLTYMTSYMTEEIDENNTKVYLTITNTSKNNGVIDSIEYGILNKNNEITYHDQIASKKEFLAGEEILIIFETPFSIDKINDLSFLLLYNNEQIKQSEKSNPKQVDGVISRVESKKLETTTNIIMDVYYNKQAKLNKLKAVFYNEDGYPICISYLNINKKVKSNKKYTYTFKCDSSIDIDSYALFKE